MTQVWTDAMQIHDVHVHVCTDLHVVSERKTVFKGKEGHQKIFPPSKKISW